MAAASRKTVELLVSRVPWTASAKEVTEYFTQYGHVTKCILPFNTHTGFHRGLCRIRFQTEQDLENVFQKNQHVLDGAMLQVQRNVHVHPLLKSKKFD